MDHINKDFITLRDLDLVDEKIRLLGEEKKSVATELTSRVNSGDSATSLVLSRVSKLIDEVKQLSGLATLDDINELISEYGELKVLLQLKALVEKRIAMEKSTLLLEKAANLENDLQNVDSLVSSADLVAILKKAGDLSSNIDLPESAKVSLMQLLTNVADSRRTTLTELLVKELFEIKWLSPKESVTIEPKKMKNILLYCSDLIDLQAAIQPPLYPSTWWAVEALLKPFVMRFNFHFRQETKANRISKPEWAFSYVEEFLADNIPALDLVISDSLFRQNRIAAFEIITAVLQPVREKLVDLINAINSHIDSTEDTTNVTEQNGRLLSHLIYESTSFDQRLRDIYKYNPHINDFSLVPEKKWLGLTSDILISELGESDAVNNWLNLELQLAKKRFNTEIIGSPNAFLLDNEFNAGSKLNYNTSVQPSYSAYGLAKLFDNLTTHFKTLSIVKYQLKYVSRILLPILDDYADALNGQFREFCESNSLNIILTFIPGASKKEQALSVEAAMINGLAALKTLTGLYCLAKFIIGKISDWEDELIFIQLWDYYKSISTKSEFENSIFESTLDEYKPLVQKILERYEVFFKKQIKEVFKQYVSTVDWKHSTEVGSDISLHLAGFVTTIIAYLSYLKKNLPDIDYFLLSGKVCDLIALTLLEYVIRNSKFSKAGVKKLTDDFSYLQFQLEDVLLLGSLDQFTNKDNTLLQKAHESIELLGHFDASAAKVMKSLFAESEGIRSQFTRGIASLTDEDIRDLLYRIV